MRRKKAKAGERRFRKLRVFIYALPVLLFITGFAYLSYARDVVPVKELLYYGNRNLSAGDLSSLMQVKKGENIFALSSRKLAEDLLSSPWVKKAAVRREILAGRLLARVEEREPFVLIKKDGALWIADADGRLLQKIEGNTVPVLPVIEADTINHKDTLDEAMALSRLLRTKGYFQKPVTVYAAGRPDELSMVVGGVLIKVGSGNYEEKLEKLRELEGEIAKRGIPADIIDLRFANRVIVSPVKEVAQ